MNWAGMDWLLMVKMSYKCHWLEENGLLWVNWKATVTQIFTHYNQAMQKSISNAQHVEEICGGATDVRGHLDFEAVLKEKAGPIQY